MSIQDKIMGQIKIYNYENYNNLVYNNIKIKEIVNKIHSNNLDDTIKIYHSNNDDTIKTNNDGNKTNNDGNKTNNDGNKTNDDGSLINAGRSPVAQVSQVAQTAVVKPTTPAIFEPPHLVVTEEAVAALEEAFFLI